MRDNQVQQAPISESKLVKAIKPESNAWTSGNANQNSDEFSARLLQCKGWNKDLTLAVDYGEYVIITNHCIGAMRLACM